MLYGLAIGQGNSEPGGISFANTNCRSILVPSDGQKHLIRRSHWRLVAQRHRRCDPGLLSQLVQKSTRSSGPFGAQFPFFRFTIAKSHYADSQGEAKTGPWELPCVLDIQFHWLLTCCTIKGRGPRNQPKLLMNQREPDGSITGT